ncbi:hypothetical protein AVEN_203364-1 [Araneus ventricosus]|uniref:Uncharacterized protein n=1 Tax=Araneus ventricosus TaxID=182803 RepID=A0A4Y2RI55_ARAVE|nr:hypothetical protein AVEN_203364-1 [Araneus ventricosus]
MLKKQRNLKTNYRHWPFTGTTFQRVIFQSKWMPPLLFLSFSLYQLLLSYRCIPCTARIHPTTPRPFFLFFIDPSLHRYCMSGVLMVCMQGETIVCRFLGSNKMERPLRRGMRGIKGSEGSTGLVRIPNMFMAGRSYLGKVGK